MVSRVAAVCWPCLLAVPVARSFEVASRFGLLAMPARAGHSHDTATPHIAHADRDELHHALTTGSSRWGSVCAADGLSVSVVSSPAKLMLVSGTDDDESPEESRSSAGGVAQASSDGAEGGRTEEEGEEEASEEVEKMVSGGAATPLEADESASASEVGLGEGEGGAAEAAAETAVDPPEVGAEPLVSSTPSITNAQRSGPSATLDSGATQAEHTGEGEDERGRRRSTQARGEQHSAATEESKEGRGEMR